MLAKDVSLELIIGRFQLQHFLLKNNNTLKILKIFG